MEVIRFYWKVLKNAISKFIEDDIFTYSAALSYYSIFSLPPVLLVILSLTNIFYSSAKVKSALFTQVKEIVGEEGAQLLMKSIENIHVFEPTIWATILSIIILIFTSTTVLVTMKNALNKIFNVKHKPEGSGLLKMVRDRLLSFAVLVSFALILAGSLVVDTIFTTFESYLMEWFIGDSITLTLLTSTASAFIIMTLQLATIFKFLPDVKLKWRDTWFGAILTSFLFGLGKYLISFYIGKSSIAGFYDVAGSIMVVMIWIFYVSLIFMFGAVFTYTRIIMMGESVPASDYAIKIEKDDTKTYPGL